MLKLKNFVLLSLILLVYLFVAPSKAEAVLLGRVILDPGFDQTCSSVPGADGATYMGAYFLGVVEKDACTSAGTTCYGAPNYNITWTQGTNTMNILANQCNNSRPNYDFYGLSVDNGEPSADGGSITVRAQVDDSNYKLTLWRHATTVNTGAGGNICKPTVEGILAPNSDVTTPPISYNVDYSNGECEWNHVWFYSDYGRAHGTLTGTQTMLIGATASYTANVESASGIKSADIWIAKIVNDSPTRVASQDIAGYNSSNFNCGASDCYWYRLGTTNNAGSYNGSATVNTAGNYVVSISAVPGDIQGQNGDLRQCSSDPYLSYPYSASGQKWYRCGDGSNDIRYLVVTTPPTPPTISNLQIEEVGTNTTFQGVNKSSGQVPDIGSGWVNPMNVQVTATSSDQITKYEVAFIDKNSGAQLTDPSSFESSVTNKFVNSPTAGFLLKYQNDGTYWVWNPNKSGCGSGGWENITNVPPPIGLDIKDCSSKLLYTVYPIVGSVAKWQVRFGGDFGSKSMYTSAYVETSSGQKVAKGDFTCPSSLPSTRPYKWTCQ